jgi:hypothetical protein
VLFELRNALKAGDVWLADSQRYGEVETALVPAAAVSSARLAVPMDGRLWLDARAKALGDKLDGVARAIDQGQLPTSAIHGGQLHVDRLEKAVPDGAEDLVLALYRDMPQARITDLLLEVDDRIAFTSAFTDLRTGIPCRDRVAVLSVLLADDIIWASGKWRKPVARTASGSCCASAGGSCARTPRPRHSAWSSKRNARCPWPSFGERASPLRPMASTSPRAAWARP